jgi:hypothetical protein
MEPPCVVPLHDEAQLCARLLLLPERLWRLAALTASAILVEAHLWIVA